MIVVLLSLFLNYDYEWTNERMDGNSSDTSNLWIGMVFIVAMFNPLGVGTTDINHSELKLEKLISHKREKKSERPGKNK